MMGSATARLHGSDLPAIFLDSVSPLIIIQFVYINFECASPRGRLLGAFKKQMAAPAICQSSRVQINTKSTFSNSFGTSFSSRKKKVQPGLWCMHLMIRTEDRNFSVFILIFAG